MEEIESNISLGFFSEEVADVIGIDDNEVFMPEKLAKAIQKSEVGEKLKKKDLDYSYSDELFYSFFVTDPTEIRKEGNDLILIRLDKHFWIEGELMGGTYALRIRKTGDKWIVVDFDARYNPKRGGEILWKGHTTMKR